MNFFDILKKRLSIFPNIQPWDVKVDIKPAHEVQRCANMTDQGSPGSGLGDQLMYPNLFRNKRRRKNGK